MFHFHCINVFYSFLVWSFWTISCSVISWFQFWVPSNIIVTLHVWSMVPRSYLVFDKRPDPLINSLSVISVGLLPQEEVWFIKVQIGDSFASKTDAVVYMVLCRSYAFTSNVTWNKLNPMWVSRIRWARLFVGIFDDDGKTFDFAGRVVLDIARSPPQSIYNVTLRAFF